MGKEKRTAAALTENPARALVATLLEVLKFTCKVVKRERERENTFCQHHYQRNREFSDRIRDNEKEVRFVTDCISMTNSKTALFSSAKRDVSTTASPIKHPNLACEKYLCARMRRRISVRDVASKARIK